MKKILITSFIVASFLNFASGADYTIKADSKVAFSVKHLKLTTVDGDFSAFSGKANYENGKLNSLEGIVEISSVSTQNAKRDEHLRANDIFDAAAHPQMTFKMSEFTDGKIIGGLVVKGKAHKLTLDSQINENADEITIIATGIVKRSELGVVWESNLKDSLVSDEVTIKLELKGAKQ